jgi:hypothetical protein
METIFKAAMNRIRANEDLKRKTEDYLNINLIVPAAVNQDKLRNPIMKRAIAAACAIVFVCAMSVGATVYYKTPASYLSLDINPSVELGINAFGKIVSATAYNSDGTTILNGQDLINTDVKDAVHTLVKSAAQKGFVAKDGSTVISVTSETDNSATAAALEDAAAQGADAAIKSEGKTATINKDNVPLEERHEAQKLGITPGKLNLIRKLQALDSSITVNEYKDSKVTDIMKKIKELKNSSKANSDDTNSSSSPTDQDSRDAASEAADNNSQVTSSESVDGNLKDTTGETDGQISQDSSDDPVIEDSNPASSKTGNTSSHPQSRAGSSKGAKSSSQTSSAPSSQPKNSTDENENE